MSLEKTERNKKILNYFKYHPLSSYEDAGKAFGISRQRVHHIVKKHCEKEMLNHINKPSLFDGCILILLKDGEV